MLKLLDKTPVAPLIGQPPSGGCVLKLIFLLGKSIQHFQPPSGGCVLKLLMLSTNQKLF